MTTKRDIRLSPAQLAIKLATREALCAGGGQELIAGEIGCAQSRLSDYASPNTADFIPADKIILVEALSAGSPGHPHITAALARAQGGAFVSLDGGADSRRAGDPDPARDSFCDHLPRIAGESGDLIRKLADAVALKDDLSVTGQCALVLEVNQLLDVLMLLHGDLTGFAPGQVAVRQFRMPFAENIGEAIRADSS